MWHYSVEGEARDPIDEASVTALIKSGQITKDTLVWREGMTDWALMPRTELAKHLPTGLTTIYNPYQPPVCANTQTDSSINSNLSWTQIFWSFKGRIPRRQFWAATGILCAVTLVANLITWALGQVVESILTVAPLIVGLIAVFVSSLAIQAKRWHDRGYTEDMVLINFAPPLWIWTLIECGCLRGTVGTNKYGTDPT